MAQDPEASLPADCRVCGSTGQVVRDNRRIKIFAKKSGLDAPTQRPCPPVPEVRKPESGCSDEREGCPGTQTGARELGFWLRIICLTLQMTF